MDGEETTNTELIFETWLYKLRGNVGEKRLSHYLSGAWNKKYFVLVREGNKPKIFYYNKRPKDYLNAQKGIILLDHHYHVDQKPAEKGKAYVFQLSTSVRNVLFAVEKEEIYDLLMFFLRTQIRLREDLEGECFIVRPERSEDHRRIGAQSAMCILHVSQWGLTLALQLSKSVLAQWPLRCIRWYECSGRGRFAIETGSHASTGSGRYVFKTRVGQDGAIYDRIDTLVNEQAKMQGMVKARVSQCSSRLESSSVSSAYSGLDRLTEVKADSRFISHLKKIARDIFDHLSEHLGERSGLMAGWNSAVSTTELISGERNCSVASAPLRSLPLIMTQSQNAVPDTSVHHGDDGVLLTSQYLHMGTPVFDASPFNDHLPSFDTSVRGSVALGSRVDYSLERFIEAPEDSGSAEVYGSKLRVGGGSARKSSFNRLRLKSFSLDDLSDYIGSNERPVSYTNSVCQNSDHRQEARETGSQVPSGWNEESLLNPYSYAKTPDFGFIETAAVKPGEAGDYDGYCRPTSELLSKTLSDPNLLQENGVYHRVKPENRGSQIRSIRHVLIGQNPSNQVTPLQMNSKADDVLSSPRNVGDSLALGDLRDAASSAWLPRVPIVMETVPSLAAGVSATPKTRVFIKQKSLGFQSPSASHAASRPSSASFGPPLMSFHAARRPDGLHGQLPSPPNNSSFARVPFAASKAKETTSFA